MKLNKPQDALVKSLIQKWKSDKIIDEKQARDLENSYEVAGFDWQNLAFIAFFFAIVCIILAVLVMVANQWLMRFLESLIATSVFFKVIFFFLLSGGFYFWAYIRSKKHPYKIYSNEAFFLLGAASLAITLVYLTFSMEIFSESYDALVLTAVICYAIVGIRLKSKVNWVLALVGAGSWFGIITFGEFGNDGYFLGMNFPMRFIPFGLLIIAIGYGIQKFFVVEDFFPRSTYLSGWLYFFVALWLVSIFGNYEYLEIWYEAKHISLLHWRIISGVTACLVIFGGLKFQDQIMRDVGFIFLLINIYTRFFEYFWDRLHTSLFFIILGLSFWLIGKQAEKLWQKSENKK